MAIHGAMAGASTFLIAGGSGPQDPSRSHARHSILRPGHRRDDGAPPVHYDRRRSRRLNVPATRASTEPTPAGSISGTADAARRT